MSKTNEENDNGWNGNIVRKTPFERRRLDGEMMNDNTNEAEVREIKNAHDGGRRIAGYKNGCSSARKENDEDFIERRVVVKVQI